MTRRVVEWTKTPRGMFVMLSIIIALWGLTIWGWLDHRADRKVEQTRAEAIEADRRAWLTAELYAPTSIRVQIGPTPETTRVIETPDFAGPRIPADFIGRWIVRLRHIGRDVLLCTMPQTGPRDASYTADSARELYMTWAEYTQDDGSCFAQMQPGEQYDLTTIREALTVIEGQTMRRFLPPVRSAPFVMVAP